MLSAEMEEMSRDAGSPKEDVSGSPKEDVSGSLKKDVSGSTKKEEVSDDGVFLEPPMREINYAKGPFARQPLSFNPVTSLFGFLMLWGVTIWCMTDPDAASKLLDLRGKVALNYTWIIVAIRPFSFFFLLFIAYKYGHVKLGRKDEEPEYGGMTYFAMIFAAGVAVGIFYFGVSEPLWHQQSHWYANAGYRSQDEIDQYAMNLTIHHWGLGGWAVYVTVALGAGLAAYRFKLPLTFRSCFYPILGEYTWGWIGDLIDGFSMVVTVTGVCTSLGLGAIQITSGLQRIGWISEDLTDGEKVNVQTLTIWIITMIATASVITGLNAGIRYLSVFAFSLGMILTLIIFVMERSAYLMNLMVQTTGDVMQNSLFQLPFHTDAFGQLREGEGRAVDGNASAEWWMDAWTIFYWNWWTSWSCFVGLFVARVSRGRTVFEVVIYSMFVPLAYCILWFGVWGGIGLRQARQALEMEQLGQNYFNDSTYFQQAGSEVCYDVPQGEVNVNGTIIFTNYLEGITPVCKFDPDNSGDAAFNVLYSFSFPDDFDIGYGPTLTVLFLISVAIYFATSSDSGSLVVDLLASNGRIEHHWLQRMFWALTEGAVATALLHAGGTDGLAALQAASIICGLPFTVFLFLILQSIYEMCEQALDEDQEFYEFKERAFQMPIYGGIFNVFEFIVSAGKVHPERKAKGMDMPKREEVYGFFQGLLVPFVSFHRILSALYPKPSSKVSNFALTAFYTFLHAAWIVLFCLVKSSRGLQAWAWAAYFINAIILAGVKMHYRSTRRVHGNPVGDFISSLFFWPQVFAQLTIGLSNDMSETEAEN